MSEAIPINPQQTFGDNFRAHAKLWFIVLLVALMANFIIFVFYLQDLKVNNELLKECMPEQLCKSVIVVRNLTCPR
jgi:hypothetical protein